MTHNTLRKYLDVLSYIRSKHSDLYSHFYEVIEDSASLPRLSYKCYTSPHLRHQLTSIFGDDYRLFFPNKDSAISFGFCSLHILYLSTQYNIQIYNSHHFKGWKLLSRNFVEKISCINALEQSVEHTFLQPSLFCSQSGNLYFPDTPESYTFLKIFESIVVEDISQSVSLLEPSSVTASYFSCPDESLSITYNT